MTATATTVQRIAALIRTELLKLVDTTGFYVETRLTARDTRVDYVNHYVEMLTRDDPDAREEAALRIGMIGTAVRAGHSRGPRGRSAGVASSAQRHSASYIEGLLVAIEFITEEE